MISGFSPRPARTRLGSRILHDSFVSVQHRPVTSLARSSWYIDDRFRHSIRRHATHDQIRIMGGCASKGCCASKTEEPTVLVTTEEPTLQSKPITESEAEMEQLSVEVVAAAISAALEEEEACKPADGVEEVCREMLSQTPGIVPEMDSCPTSMKCVCCRKLCQVAASEPVKVAEVPVTLVSEQEFVSDFFKPVGSFLSSVGSFFSSSMDSLVNVFGSEQSSAKTAETMETASASTGSEPSSEATAIPTATPTVTPAVLAGPYSTRLPDEFYESIGLQKRGTVEWVVGASTTTNPNPFPPLTCVQHR